MAGSSVSEGAMAGEWSRNVSGRMGLTGGTKQGERDRRPRRRAGDSVFVKKYASCFFGTDLASRLQSRRIDTLIVTGCTTSGCARASAVDAVQYGLRPIVPRQAVGDRARAAHDQSLFDLQAKYGHLMSAYGVLPKAPSP